MKWTVTFEVPFEPDKQDLGCVNGEYGEYLHFDSKGVYTQTHGTYSHKPEKNYYLLWSVVKRE
jgi:hypothetical protein